MSRKPVALANWKMSMTVSESLRFVKDFEKKAGNILKSVDVILCPPYTSLWPVAEELTRRPSHYENLQIGAQNMAPSTDTARTGEISAQLLADAGCRWVMVGHWEIKRRYHEDNIINNRKVLLALKAGLHPIILIGEPRENHEDVQMALWSQLDDLLDGCHQEDVAQMILGYEPEGAIGGAKPASIDHVSAGCQMIRGWIRKRYGAETSEAVRIAYGGSVTPEFAPDLLSIPDLDGVGATRRGRDLTTFVAITHQIAQAKALQSKMNGDLDR